MRNPIFEHWHNNEVVYLGHVHIDLSDLPIVDEDTGMNAHYMRGCEPDKRTHAENLRKAEEERLKRAILSDDCYHPKYNPKP